MKILSKIRAFLVSGLIILAAFSLFVSYVYNLSSGELNSLEINGLTDSVEIMFNDHYIPKVLSANEDDLFVALGYMHAKDRLWQMDLLRRKSQGRLSEILGKSSFNEDYLIRHFQLEEIAEEIYSNISPKSRRILQNYSRGVNSFINSSKKAPALEFGYLDYYPELWKPVHSILLWRFIALNRSKGFKYDLFYGALADRIGRERFNYLVSLIIDDSSTNSPVTDTMEFPAGIGMAPIKFDEGFACNVWAALRNKLDINSGSVLCNDFHSTVRLPSLFYQVHLFCPEFNFIGLTIPGIPLPLSGRNDYVSWGFSLNFTDDFDYFIEELIDEDYYIKDGKKVRMTFRKDTISIKEEEDKVFYIRQTEISSLLSDAYKKSDSSNYFYAGFDFSYNWIGNIAGDEFLALYNCLYSRSISEFNNVFDNWVSPAADFIATDISGKIISTTAGKTYQKTKGYSYLPNPGWQNEFHWNKAVDIQQSVDTSEKTFSLAANERKFYDDGINGYWLKDSRAKRISTLLDEANTYKSRDAKYMQFDVLSTYSGEFLEIVLPVLNSLKNQLDKREKKSLELLNKWDGIYSTEVSPAAIFEIFREFMLSEMIKDEIGDSLYAELSKLDDVPGKLLLNLIIEKNNSFIDNINTEEIETFNYLVLKSFKDANQYLSGISGTDEPSSWDLGMMNRLYIRHELSREMLLGPTLNFGPFNVKGSRHTINFASYIHENNEIVEYTSARIISDMRDSIVYSIIPGGASGDPVSNHFTDQVQLWLNGGYIKMNINPKNNTDYERSITLIPSGR